MLVICEECGKKYQIDPSKIRDTQATAKCKVCGHKIIIPKVESSLKDLIGVEADADGPAPDSAEQDTRASAESEEIRTEEKKAPYESFKTQRLGLRTKIFLLFFLIPIVLFVSSGILFLGQMRNLSAIIRDESSLVVTDIAESIVSEKAYAVAREVGLYLKTHPTLTEADFFKNKEFMEIAVQKVGKTGYTVLNSAPTATEPWRIRAHPKENLIGADILKATRARLSDDDFARFKKLHDTAVAQNQQVSTGYYRFLDDKEKFQAMAPVTGTNYWLISTAYLDEFTLPIQDLQTRAGLLTASTVRSVIIILSVTILLVALIAFVYGLKLSYNIRSLTDIANRISVGDLGITIDTKAKDELGDLARAIARMQDSIRLSIERLRRRRRA